MAFDVEKLVANCETEIERFAKTHFDEAFYAFAIDASMLCLNSVEQFQMTLHEYQADWDRQTRPIEALADLTEVDRRDETLVLQLAAKYQRLDLADEAACLQVINARRDHMRSLRCTYRSPDGIQSVRQNTGDWAYQGFAHLDAVHGFDVELYNEHYDAAAVSDDGRAPTTDYAIAMSMLVARLQVSDAFTSLKKSEDFSVSWVDHTY